MLLRLLKVQWEYSLMANSANLPAPLAGMDSTTAIADLKSPFCRNLLNFNTTEAGISLRNGDSKYLLIANTTGLSDQIPLRLFNYGDIGAYALILDTVSTKVVLYHIDTASVHSTITETDGSYVDYYKLYFNNYLFFLTATGSSAPGFYFDGSATGSIGYTGSGFAPIGGNVYKNRAYFIQNDEPAYWYSGIDSISGALTKVPLGGIIANKATLSIIANFTLTDSINAEMMQAFVFSNGEVLFYSGTYPDGSDWTIRGRAEVGSPLGNNMSQSYQGDTLIFCNNGVVSLRDLFLRGSEEAISLSVNTRIQKTWAELVKAIRVALNQTGAITPPQIRSVYDTLNNRIIVSFPYYLDDNGAAEEGSFYFIFDTLRKAWTTHRSYGMASGESIIDMCFYKDKVLLMCPVSTSQTMIYEKEGATGYADRSSDDTTNTPYDYEMLSAPIPFPKNANYETTTIEPILESDLYAQTNWNFVADFGRQTSGDQKTDAGTTSVAKPAVNVGMQNITYVQVKMSGTTAASKTVGLDLYSYNVWYNAGEIGSR